MSLFWDQHKHQHLLHLPRFCREFASLNIHVNAMEKRFVFHCLPKKISWSSAMYCRMGCAHLSQMLFLSGLLSLLPSELPLNLLPCRVVATLWMEKEVGCGCCFSSTTARRGRRRWYSCNSTNALINDHRTWLTLTRVNTMIAKVNT